MDYKGRELPPIMIKRLGSVYYTAKKIDWKCWALRLNCTFLRLSTVFFIVWVFGLKMWAVEN